MNVRLLVLEELMGRLGTIRKSNGYVTEGGLAVFVGETPQLGDDDHAVAIAIVPKETEPRPNRMEEWPIEIQAVAKDSIGQPYLTALDVLGDVVKAIELDDRTLGGLVKDFEIGPQRTLERLPGSTAVGISQEYRLSYVRAWGAV